MQTLDNRGCSPGCRHPPALRSRLAIAQRHRAFCGSHQSREMFPAEMSSGSLEAESFGKKFGDVRLLWAGRALKKNGRVGAELINYLPARPAGRARYTVVVG